MIKILITFFFFIYFSLPQKKLQKDLQKDLIGYIVSSQKVDFKKVSHLMYTLL